MKLAVLVKVLWYVGMCYQQQGCNRLFLEFIVLRIWGLKSSDAALSVSCTSHKMHTRETELQK